LSKAYARSSINNTQKYKNTSKIYKLKTQIKNRQPTFQTQSKHNTSQSPLRHSQQNLIII